MVTSINWLLLALSGLCLGTNLACVVVSLRCAAKTRSARRLADAVGEIEDSLESMRLLVKRRVGRDSVNYRREQQAEAAAVAGPDPEKQPAEWLKFMNRKISQHKGN